MRWFLKRRTTQEDDLDRELRAHLDLESEELNDADAARRALGNLARTKENVRQEWGFMWIEKIARDFKYALRQMRRSPGFTSLAIATLALGLGATTAMFSIVNGSLLEPLKYRDANRLYIARTIPPASSKLNRDFPLNGVQFEQWQMQSRLCESLALVQYAELTLIGAGEPAKLPALNITQDFFRTLGVQPALGRDFLPEDRTSPHVILSGAVWRSRYNSDPSILGRAIQLNGEQYTVIGVMGADFHVPQGDQWGGFFGPDKAPQLFRPMLPWVRRPVGNLNYNGLIRLKPGVTREQGIAELNTLLSDIYREYNLPTRITLIPLHEQITRGSRSALWLLLAAVGVVLLIVCVNIGNLMLVRTTGRSREAGIRLAIGASRGSLFSLVLEEALLLVTIGGAFGVLIANSALKLVVAAAPAGIPRLDEIQIDNRVLLFIAAAIAISTILCGLVPAWRLSRTTPLDSLKSGSAASTEGGGKLRFRESMVSIEVALSTVLLIAGGLLIVSFARVLSVEKGFEVAHIITQDVSFLNPKYKAGANAQFVESMLPKLAEIPGVDSAAAINQLPLMGEDWVSELEDPDQPARTVDNEALANNRFVTPDYFKTIGIPLKQGRYLNESDKGKPAAVVSEGVAKFMWPNQNPLGKHLLGIGDVSPHLEVVGVVGEVHGSSLEKAPTLMVYEHCWRIKPIGMSFVVRTRGDAVSIASEIRSVLSRADPEMAIPPARPMEQIVEASVAARRFQMLIAASFALAALLLASLGIYGVVSFAVARRTPEMGIRIALGASSGELMRMIFRQGMIPVVAGLAIGLVTSFLLGKAIASQLYGVAPRDPLTTSIVAIVLLVVAVFACWFPARRATRVDPLTALRFD